LRIIADFTRGFNPDYSLCQEISFENVKPSNTSSQFLSDPFQPLSEQAPRCAKFETT